MNVLSNDEISKLKTPREIEAAVVYKLLQHLGKDDLSGTDDEARAIARRVMADTKFKKPYLVGPDVEPHRWVVEAVEAGMAHGKSKADRMHHLVQDAQEEQHTMLNTSVIRANMVALAESILDDRYKMIARNVDISAIDGQVHHRAVEATSITIMLNLEAQRTVWDRMELTTDRSEDGKDVIFTVSRK